jgi:HEPN superfamily Apea-like protein
MYNPKAYLRHQFLSLVQALEAYHRRITKTFELPDEEHQQRMSDILAAVGAEHRDWLEEKLRYSNEPGLRKTLREIFDACPDSVAVIVGDRNKDRRGYIHKVWATRNYLTHYDEGPGASGRSLPDSSRAPGVSILSPRRKAARAITKAAIGVVTRRNAPISIAL